MYERKTLPDLNCGLDLIGEVLYGKWKMRLLWFINEGFKRPSELLILKKIQPVDSSEPSLID